MTQISGMDEKKVAEITMITGCLAIITCILIAVMMTLVYSQIKNWDEGILVVITITGIAAGGVALVLYPVISRCKSRQVFMALAILVLLPTLLLASDFFRTSGFNEIPWGSWTLIILFCGVTTLFVSQIQSYFRQPLGNLRPVYHVTFLSMGVMILAAGSGAITEILGKMVTGNLFVDVWISILFAVYLLVLVGLVYLGILGIICVQRYLAITLMENGYEK